MQREHSAFAKREALMLHCRDTQLQGSRSLQHHHAPVRAIAFDSTGRLFLSAGDDKLVKVWSTGSWELLQTA